MAYWSRTGVKSRRCRFDSCWVGLIFTSMKLTQRQVRRLIEAEVDTMRVPNGPNSRDDGDKDMTEVELAEHLRERNERRLLGEEYDPVATFLTDQAHNLKAALDVLDREVQGSADAFEAMDTIHKVIRSLERQASAYGGTWQPK